MKARRKGFRIAILGAESTGKSQLARALEQHFMAQGLSTYRIDEYLREWCDQQQRTPTQDEQILMLQAHIDRLAQAPADAIVISDTTPIMTAVYSQLLFQDHSLNDLALSHQQLFDVTFLTGLDVPWVADGLQRDGPHVRAPVDAAIRALLAQGSVPFHVVYGQGDVRLNNALLALSNHAPQMQAFRQEIAPRWQGVCETCGDGECEHRLFSQLLKR